MGDQATYEGGGAREINVARALPMNPNHSEVAVWTIELCNGRLLVVDTDLGLAILAQITSTKKEQKYSSTRTQHNSYPIALESSGHDITSARRSA